MQFTLPSLPGSWVALSFGQWKDNRNNDSGSSGIYFNKEVFLSSILLCLSLPANGNVNMVLGSGIDPAGEDK